MLTYLDVDLFSFSVQANPNVTYRIHKKSGTVSPSPSESSIHNLYKKVQKGGDIPLEGLGGPIPPRKGDFYNKTSK